MNLNTDSDQKLRMKDSFKDYINQIPKETGSITIPNNKHCKSII